ncbi:LTA synthase family protein [Hufsiella ginkgonis]|uniref:Sulfatase-like hydrolase/transferase n=1 Tax=Hufsiella ginkgonis TaxID=2695274 RepID=A0A7K1XX07_9SPHI|nr:alkaline phosphatase family protein [Hufsiella ginkgonis]MXV15535.1 sulfatase-like hydrolase/transferase [Hufsiella ginkgonis]
MLKSLVVLGRYFLFWLVFFFLDRVLFLVYFPSRLKGLPALEISKTFIYGLWMDVSMTGYICVLPLLGFFFAWTNPKLEISKKPLQIYTRFWVAIFGILTIANFNIYREWSTKINFKALDFLFSTPNEAFASSASSPIFYSFLIFFAFAAIILWLEKKIIIYKVPAYPKPWIRVACCVLLAGINFLAIRGGWQLSPMNESMAYFSDKPFLNHAAINTEWTLMRDILKNKYGKKNPYNYFAPKESARVVADLFKTDPDSSRINILSNNRPNVVIIILESYTADVVEYLGGEKGIDPNMEALGKQGIRFTNAYAAGDRTDKGMIAVLSGFPSQAIRSIINFNSKQEHLPALSRELSSNGYHTSFYYGGESEFFNVKSYMLSHSVKRLVDKHAFNSADMNSKWGAYDHVVFNKQLLDLEKEPQPFFSTLLTLTNHEPFELPVASKFPGKDIPNKFRSTAFYADSCLGDYFRKAKKAPWYHNTLFVIVADHGHHLPKEQYEIHDPHRFRIPLLVVGEPIKESFKGKVADKIMSQTDIAATLLGQLNLPSASFKWSKDVFNPGTPAFAFYNWDNGFGFATPQQTISFDNIGKHLIYRKNKVDKKTDDSLSRVGKACMQQVFSDYMNY